jgi:hypothetical protein
MNIARACKSHPAGSTFLTKIDGLLDTFKVRRKADNRYSGSNWPLGTTARNTSVAACSMSFKVLIGPTPIADGIDGSITDRFRWLAQQ